MVIKAENVDSFRIKPGQQPARNCAYKGCRRAGRVTLYYTITSGRQDREDICTNHAFDLANNVLQKYKFGR